MAQKTAQEIRNLKSREAKCWRVIDQLLSPKKEDKVPAIVRFAAAEFILKRLYPEKKILAGDGPEGEFVIKVEIADEDNAPQEPGNRLKEYFEV